MVAQNTLRTNEEKHDSLHFILRLLRSTQIYLPISLHTCTPISELPSYINTRVEMSNDMKINCRILACALDIFLYKIKINKNNGNKKSLPKDLCHKSKPYATCDSIHQRMSKNPFFGLDFLDILCNKNQSILSKNIKKTAFVVKLLKFPTAVDLNQCFKQIIFKVFNSEVRSSF